ncbi:hypothetical protein WA026_000036 [Henosepilachna vigintioctopunctata]|uniref:Transposase n=1 Tax=Henosepilachna vigintioctopunctata TaxID=420089 RepID=A0AAW1V2L2_9CUCU
MTVDDTWVHHYTPENEEHPKQWVGKGKRTPKEARTILPTNQVMATVHWNAREITYIDSLEKGKTIRGQYYAERLKDEMQIKRRHEAKKRFFFITITHQRFRRLLPCPKSNN